MPVVAIINSSLLILMSSPAIGTCKVQGVRREIEAEDCCNCILDVELSPEQQRKLEFEFGGEAKGIKVLSRTALILDIFAQHAAAKEGQLQVELALYQYRLPSLTMVRLDNLDCLSKWVHILQDVDHLERQSGVGGVWLCGRGESPLEVYRRPNNTRMSKIKRDLELFRGIFRCGGWRV